MSDGVEETKTIPEWAWLEGHISVAAAIQGGKRQVETVYIQPGKWQRDLWQLRAAAEAADIPVEPATAELLAAHATGQSHGGVLARVGPRRFTPLADLLALEVNPALVMLDGIEDPFNFGQAVRSLYAAGVTGLVVRERNWFSAAGIVTRASAGAAELIPTAVAATPAEAAQAAWSQGLRVACATRESSVSIYEADLSGPLFVLIGGEKRGVTRSFAAEADLRLRIPYQRAFGRSLGAAAAAAIIAFEMLRQRGQETPRRRGQDGPG